MSDHPTGAAVRPVVLESWKRSRSHQISSISPRMRVVDMQTMRQLSSQNTELLRIAAPVLEHAQKWLSNTYSMLMLTDAQGMVLRVTGDSRAMALGQEIGLQQGGFWHESDTGTNAIGTALAVNAPVRIHAFEHFCQQVQRWSCAAAPVREPRNGRLLGVVDISSPASHASEQSLAFATMLAQQIHSLIEQQRQEQHGIVLQYLLSRLPHFEGRTVVAIDRNGKILHTNTPQSLHDTVLHQHLHRDHLDIFERTCAQHWRAELHRLCPDTELERVQAHNDTIGAVLILPQTGKARAAPQRNADTQMPAAARTTEAVAQARAETSTRPWSLPPEYEPAFRHIVGHSTALRANLEQAVQIARAGLPVLLEGETGTGKEMFAQAIHNASRAGRPFVPVNCGGLPQELIGSEIFGYERGAFTGAAQTGRAGKLEAANGGTLCLDEIGEMPLNLQPYLLRVLEDRKVYRIGSHVPYPVDVHLIAMTNRNLQEEVQAGRFRQDLFYRIAVARLRIAPLRERADDIPALAAHFAQAAAQKVARKPPVFSAAAVHQLQQYHWPGNIRQLRNTIEMLVMLQQRDWIDTEHLPQEMASPRDPGAAPCATAAAPPCTTNLKQLKQETMLRVIHECGGNLSAAARQLGIARSTLYCRMRKLD